MLESIYTFLNINRRNLNSKRKLIVEMINKQNSAKKKKKGKGKGIGIFISTDSTFEIAEIDFASNEIINYLKMDTAYDPIIREVNIENFESTLQTALQQFDITPQTPITVTLPSIFINTKVLPSELEEEEIYTALISETEKNYIFKKTEPAVSWHVISQDTDNQFVTVLYSALQKSLITEIENVFKKQGLKLTTIETSYGSFIRGLSVAEATSNQTQNDLTRHAIIIKHNINTVITLQGNNILNIIETPLVLGSQEKDELYPALSSSIIEKIGNNPVDSLIIANYSPNIDTNNLITYLNFKCPIIKIENNCLENEPLFNITLKEHADIVTPEVIGAAYKNNAPTDFSFNFLQTSNGYDEVPDFLANLGVTGNPVHLGLIALITVATALIAFVSISTVVINGFLIKQYRQAYVQCDAYKRKFDKPQEKIFDLFNIAEKDFIKNEKIVSSYDAISAVIPEKVWITSIKINGDLNTDIYGKAYSVEDIVSYYKNLLSASKFKNLKIKSIRVAGYSSSDMPEISINTGTRNAPPQRNSRRGRRNTMLPPPPPSGATPSVVVNTGAGIKYYEFNFGNTQSNTSSEENNDSKKSKSFIPNLSGIARKLGR